jgi:hypothetical protein
MGAGGSLCMHAFEISTGSWHAGQDLKCIIEDEKCYLVPGYLAATHYYSHFDSPLATDSICH